MAEAEAVLGTSIDADRYYRIVRLLRAGTKIIRELFDIIHDPSNLQNALRIHRATLQSLRHKILSEVEWKKLYPSNFSYGKSRDFDLTLLFKLLRNICNLTSPSTGWDKLPQDTEISLESDIVRIKYHRNTTFAHNDEMKLSEDEFDDCWEQIKGALLRRIVVYYKPSDVRKWEKQIDKSRTSAITEEDRKSFLSEFPGIAVKCVVDVAKRGRWIAASVWDYHKEYLQSLLKEIQDVVSFITPGIIVEAINEGSVVIQIRFTNCDALEDFWERYQTDKLRNVLEKVLVTEEIRRLGDQVELAVSVSEDEYLHARTYRKTAVASEAEKEVEEVTETIEKLSLDGGEVSLVHGPLITDRKSKFQAHFVEVTSLEEVDQVLSHITKNLQHTEITNIIWAYRVYEADRRVYIHASDDGGEYLAGSRLEHLLNEINISNVVVIVTCWDGDVYLGLEKFQNINKCALSLLMSHEMVQRMTPDEVALFLEQTKNYFEARKHKATYAAYALAQEAKPKTAAEFEILHGEVITVPKSSFQAHLARVTSQDQVEQVLAQLKEDRKIQRARFNMLAYRIYDEEKKEYLEEGRDDGESKGGKRLLHLLQTSEVKNAVVIVTRWKEGDVKLGPERFKYINACATVEIKMATELGWIEAKASGVEQKKSKKKGKKKSTKKLINTI